MDRHGVRYCFEHRLLPGWFFEHKEGFVGLILHDKNILFEMINDIFTDEKVSNPYEKEDFVAIASKVTDEVKVLKIIFPEPEEEPLCYCSYIFFELGIKSIFTFIMIYLRQCFLPDVYMFTVWRIIAADTAQSLTFAYKVFAGFFVAVFPRNIIVQQKMAHTRIRKIRIIAVKNFIKNNSCTV